MFNTMISRPEQSKWSSLTLGRSICRFQRGKIRNKKEVEVGKTRTPSECAALIAKTEPDANGAIYGVRKPSAGVCLASFQSSGHKNAYDWDGWNKDGVFISCLFEGSCEQFNDFDILGVLDLCKILLPIIIYYSQL